MPHVHVEPQRNYFVITVPEETVSPLSEASFLQCQHRYWWSGFLEERRQNIRLEFITPAIPPMIFAGLTGNELYAPPPHSPLSLSDSLLSHETDDRWTLFHFS